MFHRLRGTGLKAPLLHPRDLLWDLRLGVRTFGFVPAIGRHSEPDWRAHYLPTEYATAFRTMRHVALGSDDVFVDLGSGLGRMVFAATHLGAKRAIGVEIDADLHRRAAANVHRMRRGRERVTLIEGSASDFPVDEATVVFLYHPFGAGTLARVIRRLDESLERSPRALRLVYLNPVHGAVVDASSRLVTLDRWPSESRKGAGYPVGFWRTPA